MTCISPAELAMTLALEPPMSTAASAGVSGKFAPCRISRPPGASSDVLTRLAALSTPPDARIGGGDVSRVRRPVDLHSPLAMPGRSACIDRLTAPEPADAGVHVPA